MKLKLLSILFVCSLITAPLVAQGGPFSAQIQRALEALGISSDGSGGTSITDLTITGTCTGCGATGATAGITASATQTQGQGALTESINQVSTVATTNDVVTLPTAVAGNEVAIINDGANTLQVFPASGDNLGLGLNTSTVLRAGKRAIWYAYDATNWKRFSEINSTELINNTTWGDGTAATNTWTFDILTGTDPAMLFGNNTMRLAAGSLLLGAGTGAGVVLTGDVTGTDVTLSFGNGTASFSNTLLFGAGFGTNSKILASSTAPSINAGFGSGAAVTASNGTTAFRVGVGTTAGSTGTLTMPTATTGWNCMVNNLTSRTDNDGHTTVQLSSTTTTVVVENQNEGNGAAVDWTDSDVLAFMCFAY
jgi:hypothetical protein